MYGYSIVHMAIFAGSTTVVVGKFDPVVFLSAIQQYRPRLLFTVPPIVIFLTKYPKVDEYDCSSIEFILSGAAPIGRETCLEFHSKHTNVKFLSQVYGMTESGVVSHLPILNVKEPYKGVGKPMSTFEQKVVDLSIKDMIINNDMEVCVRSPILMMGYLNRPEATAETIDKEGWLHTGDIGYMDEDCRTYIVDRLKELIKVKGLQVAPAEVEDLLLSHPLIRDCAVIGIPDERMGELVRAYVVRANESLNKDDVCSFVAMKLSPYKHITGGVKFVPSIPKSPSGKILRRYLRDEITATDSTKSVTFHELHALAHSVRAFLRVRGFSPGDMACLVLSNCIEWAVFQLGAMAAGGAISGASAVFTDCEV
ncbi:hypothetical protein PENTCL1PPCAC_16997, partial [Pristionchus entomophagus]